MRVQNKVVTLDAPMDSLALDEMNVAGWGLIQVVMEQRETYRHMNAAGMTVKKVLYDYRYHHYFTR